MHLSSETELVGQADFWATMGADALKSSSKRLTTDPWEGYVYEIDEHHVEVILCNTKEPQYEMQMWIGQSHLPEGVFENLAVGVWFTLAFVEDEDGVPSLDLNFDDA